MWYKRRVLGMFLAMMLTFTMVPGGFAAEETADISAEGMEPATEDLAFDELKTAEEPTEENMEEKMPAAEEGQEEDEYTADTEKIVIIDMEEEPAGMEKFASPTMNQKLNLAEMEATADENGWITYTKTEEQINVRKEQIRQEVEANRETIYAQQETLREQGIEYTPRSNLETYSADNTEKLVGGYIMRGEAERMICQVAPGWGVYPSIYDLGIIYGFKTVNYYKGEGSTLSKREAEWKFDYYTYSVDIAGITFSPYYFDERGDSYREGSTKALISINGCDVVILADENGNLSELYQYWTGEIAMDVLISDEDFGLYEEYFTRTYMVKPGDMLSLDNFYIWDVDSYTVSKGILDENGRVRADAQRGRMYINFKNGETEFVEIVVYTDPGNPPLSRALEKYFEDWYVDGKYQYWFPSFLDYAAGTGMAWWEPCAFDPGYYTNFYGSIAYASVDFSDSNGPDGGPNLLPRAIALLEKVSRVELENQGLHGKLPDLSPLGRALELDLSDNKLVGNVGYYTDGSLTLDLSSNQLSGIDGDMKNSAISKVDLSGNYISVEEIAQKFRSDQLQDPNNYHQLTFALKDSSNSEIQLEVGEKLEDKLQQGLFQLTQDGLPQPFSRLSELEFKIEPAEYEEESFNGMFIENNGKFEAINEGSVKVNVGFAVPGEALPEGSNQIVTIDVQVGAGVGSDLEWLRLYMRNYEKVSGNFTLPQVPPVEMCTVEWTSSNEEYIRPDGTVTRPQYYDVPVTLNAKLTRPDGSRAGSEDFYVLVLAEENFKNSMVAASSFNDTHSMVILDGKLYSAGDNVRGQLGNGTFTDSNTPVEVMNYLDQKMTSVKKVSNGLGYSMFLNNDGRVWAVGFNQYGKLGDGTSENQNKAYPVRGKNGNGFLRDFVDISAGYRHSIAVKNDGSVWAWGSNSTGQLGDNSHSTRTMPVRVKGYQAEWLDNIEKVYANADTSMALRRNGTVYMWGNNEKGQLGNGNKKASLIPDRVRGENGIGYLEDIVSIATAEGCSMALSRTGEVWTWGGNQNGRLGDGTTAERLYPGKVYKADEFGGGVLNQIAAVSAGYYFNAALDIDGSVWVWGKNDAGQLGIDSVEDQYKAVKVKGINGEGYLSNVKSISCGKGYMLAMQRDNKILAWGNNQYGQFGIGRMGQNFNTPTYAFEASLYDDIDWLSGQMEQYKEVSDDISLPAAAPGGSSIVWKSSDPYYITADGLVMQPGPNAQDVNVTLSAWLTKGGETLESRYSIKIIKNVNSNGSMQTAQSVDKISQTVGRIYSSQTRWYRLQSDLTGVMDIRLKDATPGAVYGLVLCDSTGAEIAADEQKEQTVALTNQRITANAVYYIKVYMKDFAQEGNRFTLAVDFRTDNNKEMKVTVTEGKQFELVISDWTLPNYFVRYDPAFLRLIDAAAETEAAETEAGAVTGTPIEITEIKDGAITFKFTGRGEGKKLINKMLFEAIQTGNTGISTDAY